MSSISSLLVLLLSLILTKNVSGYQMQINRIYIKNLSGNQMKNWYFRASVNGKKDETDVFTLSDNEEKFIYTPFNDNINTENAVSMVLDLMESRSIVFGGDDVHAIQVLYYPLLHESQGDDDSVNLALSFSQDADILATVIVTYQISN
mmetsp:Transcript_40332/g.35582  ORF Transcript_40332/g.35582 Transcript_40332/m.35582 type:complete len:148 (-) Transcript_40332:27-470(-)